MLHRLKILTLIALCLLHSVVGAQQQVMVPSLDMRDGQAVQMPGFWFAAHKAMTAPAMLLLHGCGGPYSSSGQLSSRMKSAAASLNAMGISVLVTDSLMPRGEKELCTQRIGSRKLTQTERRRDALGALRWLSTRADPERLGLLGWSNGGSTLLAASNQNDPEVLASPVQASLAIAFYPGCEAELKHGYIAGMPILLLVGAADDWTPAAPCKALAAADPLVEIEVYPGAYHGFDANSTVQLRKDVPNGVHPGQGVHVGGNPTARAASAKRVAEFLRENWQPLPP